MRILTILLLAVGTLRGLAMLCADPLIALANNYDMIRVQACIDAYPIRDASIPLWSNSFEAPLRRYQFAAVDTPCFFSSETLFAVTALPAMWLESKYSSDGGFSIRWIGAVKLLFLALLAWFVAARLLTRAPKVAAVYAGFFALIVTDPALLLYLNTFYAEFSAVFFAYLLLSIVLLDACGFSLIQWYWRVIAFASPIALSLSKVQHLAVPLLIVGAVAACMLSHKAGKLQTLRFLALGAVTGLLVQVVHLKSEQAQSMGNANIINAVFYGVLENSSAPERTLERLGLPSDCARYIGDNWFTAGMQERKSCPEIFELSRPQMAVGLLREPATIVRTVLGGIVRMRPWIPSYLGVVEDEKRAALPSTYPSIDTILKLIPGSVFFVLFALLPIFGLWTASVAMRRQQHNFPPFIAVFSLCPSVLLAFVVVGDGYADTAKQAHLAMTFFVCALLLISIYWLSQLGSLPKARKLP